MKIVILRELSVFYRHTAFTLHTGSPCCAPGWQISRRWREPILALVRMLWSHFYQLTNSCKTSLTVIAKYYEQYYHCDHIAFWFKWEIAQSYTLQCTACQDKDEDEKYVLHLIFAKQIQNTVSPPMKEGRKMKWAVKLDTMVMTSSSCKPTNATSVSVLPSKQAIFRTNMNTGHPGH